IITSSRQDEKGKEHSTSKRKTKGKAKATLTSAKTREAIILCVPGNAPAFDDAFDVLNYELMQVLEKLL
ncbi:hypothetical protein HAX54_006486, partial [Datura stramonium]|nr:hypothetical protein [Datura stramonium]